MPKFSCERTVRNRKDRKKITEHTLLYSNGNWGDPKSMLYSVTGKVLCGINSMGNRGRIWHDRKA